MAVETGSTAFLLVCMALVQLMLPGLAFFYAGLLGEKSVITMIMQNYCCMGLVTMLWFMFGFSLCFGYDSEDSGIRFYGDISTFGGFKDVEGTELQVNGATFISGIPGLVFAGYQGMFAVITPALMTGAFADRMRFGPYLFFVAVWLIIVYCPFCHWIWGPEGWLYNWGVRDFAGGIVVHTTAGFSALACVNVLGSRTKQASAGTPPGQKPPSLDTSPHNIPFVALGTALLWFGWFGFNGGSALSAGAGSAFAAVNSEIAASTALTVWVAIEWVQKGKPSLVGLCVGAIAGLATITPCAGFVRPWGAFILGAFGAVWCYISCMVAKHFGADDALDVWGVHGMGGVLGSIMLGALTVKDVGGLEPSGELFGKQICAVLLAAAYSYFVAAGLLKLMGLVVRLNPTAEEMMDLDGVLHGEQAYSPYSKQRKHEPNLGTLTVQIDPPAEAEAPAPARVVC